MQIMWATIKAKIKQSTATIILNAVVEYQNLNNSNDHLS